LVTDLQNNAEACVATLIASGVDHFFLVVGGNAMFLNEAIRASKVKYTVFHHEQAAAMAAEAYARLNNKIAACISTSGPGASNLITGVAGAFLDSVPVIYISGQAKSGELTTGDMAPGVRQFGTFELPVMAMMQPITKEARRLTNTDDVCVETKRLLQLSLKDRSGPVYLEIPLDMQSKMYTPKSPERELSSEYPKATIRELSDETHLRIDEFIRELAKASRPVILAGHGIRASGTLDSFLELVSRLRIPVITTQIAKDLIPYSNPFFVGHFGIRGDRAGNLCLQEADLILTLGTSLQQQSVGYSPDRFAPMAKKFIADFENSISAKRLNLENANYINDSLKNITDLLLIRLVKGSQLPNVDVWSSLNQSRKEKFAVNLEPHAQTDTYINLYNFVDSLSKHSSEFEIIVSDAGLCYYVLGQALLLKEGQRYIVSGGLGAMGYAIPAGIGASINATRRVYCVTGDGSAQLNIQELATLSELQTNLTIFVINNNGYASIRNTQKAFFGGNLIGSSEHSGLRMPSWEFLAKAYGLKYLKIEKYAGLDVSMKVITSQTGPLLVEVLCQEDQILMPSIQSTKSDSGELISNDLNEMWPNLQGTLNIETFN